MSSPVIKVMADNLELFEHTFEILGLYDVFPPEWWLVEEFQQVCAKFAIICDIGDFLVAD
jgi:hypothetical protein